MTSRRFVGFETSTMRMLGSPLRGRVARDRTGGVRAVGRLERCLKS